MCWLGYPELIANPFQQYIYINIYSSGKGLWNKMEKYAYIDFQRSDGAAQ